MKIQFPYKKRKIGLVLGEDIGFPMVPFVRRWVLDLHWFSIRIHKWRWSDDLRFPHDHSWNFISIILKGEYLEHINVTDPETGQWNWEFKRKKAGNITRYKMNHSHKVQISHSKNPVWTLIITGKYHRRPGYWIKPGKRMNQNKYFFEYGLHDPRGGKPKRTKSYSEGYSETVTK